MKQLNLFSLFVILSVFIHSCDTLPCEELNCGEHGVCDETNGECACNTGFVINQTTGLCDCVENATYNDSTQRCECDYGWLMHPITGTCVNPCDLINCGLNGDCNFNTGECICDPGYGPGDLSPCEAYNLKFHDDWTGTHTNQINQQVTGPYTMALSPMMEADGLLFQNFMNLFCSGPQTQVDADGTINSPGTDGGNISAACPEWVVSNSTFELLNDSTLRVNATVEPSMGGPQQILVGTYIRQ